MSNSQSPRSRGSGLFGGGGSRNAIGRPVEKAKDFKGTLRKLPRYLKPHRFSFAAAIVISLFSTLFSIAGPKILGLATTELARGVMAEVDPSVAAGQPFDVEYFGVILLTVVGLYLLMYICNISVSIIMTYVSQRAVMQMRADIKLKLDKLPISYFDAVQHGDLMSRMTNDIDNVATTLQHNLTQIMTSVVTVVGVLVIMLTISPVLSLISIATLPLSALITWAIARISQKQYKLQQNAMGEISGHVEEMLSGHTVVRLFGMENASTEKFEKLNRELYKAGWKAQFMSGILYPALNLLSNIGYVLVCVFGGIFVAQRLMTVGDVQAFIMYTRHFTHPILQVANIANVIQSAIASAERIFEVLEAPEEVETGGSDTVDPDAARGDVELSHVRFRYDHKRPLLENVSLEVKAGQTVAIVGATGAGKTTLVSLLMRFYDITSGKVTIDGHNIADMTRDDTRALFGMVLQDAWLHSGTVRENIAFGREGAADEEIERAARSARADEFIRKLPEGYETRLNEEASNISQGQKQLLTIARALLSDPAILILDEATSNVDTRTELLLQEAMRELMRGRTCFVIAHRLSTIQNADIILVMRDGAIVEKGTFWELLQTDGYFKELYYSQFSAS